MRNHSWKLGEQCFIADLNLSTQPIRARVMPAQVIHVTGRIATAMSANPERFGPTFTDGTPYRTVREARAALRAELRKRLGLAASLRRLPLEGCATHFPVPEGFPSLGQVVYLIDAEHAEVLEVETGFLHLVDGAGYDEAPGNPEASMRQIREWFADKNRALAVAAERHAKRFAFVTKEEVAARATEAIDKIWDDAAARMKDPTWMAQTRDDMEHFFADMNARHPIAAG